jgi:hypothetical protein
LINRSSTSSRVREEEHRQVLEEHRQWLFRTRLIQASAREQATAIHASTASFEPSNATGAKQQAKTAIVEKLHLRMELPQWIVSANATVSQRTIRRPTPTTHQRINTNHCRTTTTRTINERIVQHSIIVD